MTEAHIVPGLTHASLVATKKFCDAGCRVIFDADECHIHYKGKLVLTGTRDNKTRLWIVPINPTAPREDDIGPLDLASTPQQHMAANVYTLPFKQ